MDDIKNLMQMKNLWGVITGKAIYSGTLDLKEAIKITIQNTGISDERKTTIIL
jgi:phosphoribosylformimino-5-aminoimidazole carboxamide ribotide isomerase